MAEYFLAMLIKNSNHFVRFYSIQVSITEFWCGVIIEDGIPLRSKASWKMSNDCFKCFKIWRWNIFIVIFDQFSWLFCFFFLCRDDLPFQWQAAWNQNYQAASNKAWTYISYLGSTSNMNNRLNNSTMEIWYIL